MEVHVSVLGSGSKGNAIVVASDDACILIDCGFSVREISRRLQRLEINLDLLCGIVVTHEHADHTKGLGKCASTFNLPVYSNLRHDEISVSRDIELRKFQALEPFSCGPFTILPVPVSHDARSPVGFVIEYGQAKCGIFTDLGTVTREVREAVQDVTVLIVEANYDEMMLATSSYPRWLCNRISSIHGHLGNSECARFLREHGGHLKEVILAHLSGENNCPSRALPTMIEPWGGVEYVPFELSAAGQHEPTPLRRIAPTI